MTHTKAHAQQCSISTTRRSSVSVSVRSYLLVLISVLLAVVFYALLWIPVLEQMPMMVSRCDDPAAQKLLHNEPGQVVIDTNHVRCHL